MITRANPSQTNTPKAGSSSVPKRKKGVTLAWCGLGGGHSVHIPSSACSEGLLPVGRRIHRCKVALALLELPNPTRPAISFKLNVVSQTARPLPRTMSASLFLGIQRRNRQGLSRVEGEPQRECGVERNIHVVKYALRGFLD